MTKPDTELNLYILLAEDNPANQMVTGKLLEQLGCQYIVVGNGVECLDRLKDDQYDLILMDCLMPEMDGLEAAGKIRASGGHCADIPIIALTARAQAADEQACLDAGMNGYIDKPVSLERMRNLLSEWAERIRGS